ncbi:MAG: TolC family protein, partial [Proteobacteria bacterium]
MDVFHNLNFRIFSVSLVLSAFVCAVPLAQAETVLDWQSCVDIAAANNANLRAATADWQSTRSQEGVARSNLFPQLSASLGYTKNGTAGAANGTPITQGYSASLNGSQNIFNGLQDLGRIKQSRANSEASLQTQNSVRAQVSYDLKAAFEGVVYAKDYTALTEQIIHRREENFRLVSLRFQSGRENKGSVLLSEAYLNQARYDDLQARNAQRVARAQLARAVGLDDFDLYDIQGSVPVSEPPSTPPEFKLIAQSTPAYRQAAAQEAASQAAISIARSQFFPTLGVSGSISRFDDEFFPNAPNRWSTGVSLAFPFFTGGRDYYSTRAAMQSWSASENRRVNVSRQTVSTLEQTFATYVEGVSKFKVDESFR